MVWVVTTRHLKAENAAEDKREDLVGQGVEGGLAEEGVRGRGGREGSVE
jgi:hypothetical protein